MEARLDERATRETRPRGVAARARRVGVARPAHAARRDASDRRGAARTASSTTGDGGALPHDAAQRGRTTSAALVDDLFELSRTQAGALRLQFERVSLGDLVSDVLAGSRAGRGGEGRAPRGPHRRARRRSSRRRRPRCCARCATCSRTRSGTRRATAASSSRPASTTTTRARLRRGARHRRRRARADLAGSSKSRSKAIRGGTPGGGRRARARDRQGIRRGARRASSRRATRTAARASRCACPAAPGPDAGPRHRRRGLHRVARRRRCSPAATRSSVSMRCSRPPTTRRPSTSTATREYAGATSPTRRSRGRRSRGSTPSRIRRRWSGSASTSPTSPSTSQQRPRHRDAAARRSHDRGSPGASSSPAAWSCTARALPLRRARRRAARRRDRDRPRARTFEPPCPQCGARAAVRSRARGRRRSIPRNVYAATKLHQEHLVRAFAREHPGVTGHRLRYHNVYGPRMPRDTPYAGVASIFRSALERATPAGVRRRWPAARLRARARCRPGEVVALDVERSRRPATQRRERRRRTRCSRWPTRRWPCPSRRPHSPEVVGSCRLGDVRHVFASTDVINVTALPARGELRRRGQGILTVPSRCLRSMWRQRGEHGCRPCRVPLPTVVVCKFVGRTVDSAPPGHAARG